MPCSSRKFSSVNIVRNQHTAQTPSFAADGLQLCPPASSWLSDWLFILALSAAFDSSPHSQLLTCSKLLSLLLFSAHFLLLWELLLFFTQLSRGGLFSVMPFLCPETQLSSSRVHIPWLDFMVLESLFHQLSTWKFSSNQKSLPSVFTPLLIFPACVAQSSCHFHTYTTYHPSHYQFEAPQSCKGPQPSQPPPQGIPWLCQDAESSPSPYSKLTIICSVHLTCLKNQFLWELVNIT